MDLKQKLKKLKDDLADTEAVLEEKELKIDELKNNIEELRSELAEPDLPLWSQWCDQKMDWLQEHWDEFRVEDLEAMLELKNTPIEAI